MSWYIKLYASQVDKLNSPVQFKYRQLEFGSIQDGYQAMDQWDGCHFSSAGQFDGTIPDRGQTANSTETRGNVWGLKLLNEAVLDEIRQKCRGDRNYLKLSRVDSVFERSDTELLKLRHM